MSSPSTSTSAASSLRAEAPTGWWGWFAWGLFAAVIAVMYRDTAVQLFYTWMVDPNYSHGVLVPFVSLYFVYAAWKQAGPPFQANVPLRAMLAGVGEVGAGFVVHLVSWYFAQPLFDLLGLVLILRGLLVVLGGTEIKRAYGFAAVFLLFAAPLPPAAYQSLALFLQEFVSIVSTAVFDLFQIPVYREGYKIFLPGIPHLDVGPACSGMRSITAYLALGVCLARLSNRGMYYKLVVGSMGVPIAVAANCVRVVLTGLIGLWAGAEYAAGLFHYTEGTVIVVLGAVLMVALVLLLEKLDDTYHWGGRRREPAEATPLDAGLPAPSGEER